MNGVDEGSSEPWSSLSEGVDGLHDPGVRGVVKVGDSVAYLVDDVDFPLAAFHGMSIANAIPRLWALWLSGSCRWRRGTSGGAVIIFSGEPEVRNHDHPRSVDTQETGLS